MAARPASSARPFSCVASRLITKNIYDILWRQLHESLLILMTQATGQAVQFVLFNDIFRFLKDNSAAAPAAAPARLIYSAAH